MKKLYPIILVLLVITACKKEKEEEPTPTYVSPSETNNNPRTVRYDFHCGNEPCTFTYLNAQGQEQTFTTTGYRIVNVTAAKNAPFMGRIQEETAGFLNVQFFLDDGHTFYTAPPVDKTPPYQLQGNVP